MQSYTVNENKYGKWIVGTLSIEDFKYFTNKWIKEYGKAGIMDIDLINHYGATILVTTVENAIMWSKELGICN